MGNITDLMKQLEAKEIWERKQAIEELRNTRERLFTEIEKLKLQKNTSSQIDAMERQLIQSKAGIADMLTDDLIEHDTPSVNAIFAEQKELREATVKQIDLYLKVVDNIRKRDLNNSVTGKAKKDITPYYDALFLSLIEKSEVSFFKGKEFAEIKPLSKLAAFIECMYDKKWLGEKRYRIKQCKRFAIERYSIDLGSALNGGDKKISRNTYKNNLKSIFK